MRKLVLAATLAAVAAPAVALADPPPWAPAHGRRAHEGRIYDERGRYYEPRAIAVATESGAGMTAATIASAATEPPDW